MNAYQTKPRGRGGCVHTPIIKPQTSKYKSYNETQLVHFPLFLLERDQCTF